MGQYYDPDEVCHFRHFGYIESCAPGPNNTPMLLTAVSNGTAWTGDLVCTGSQESVNGSVSQHFWLLTDRPGAPQEDDIGYVAFSGVYHDEAVPHSTDYFHNVRFSFSLGSQATIAITDNRFDSTEQLCFVPQGPQGFAIMLPGTSACLTAGPSPAASISSASVSIYVTTFTGAKNQIWAIEPSHQLAGCYQLAPAAAPELGVLSPGQGIANGGPIGIGAYEGDDITATWYAMPCNSIAYGNDHYSNILFFWQDKTCSIYRDSQSAGASAIQAMRPVDDAYGSPIEYLRTLDWYVGQLTAYNGNWDAMQYADSVFASGTTCLSSAEGGDTVSPNLKFDTISTSTGQDNISQYFFAIPRNLYDPSLPQCQDLQLVMHDLNTGETRTLNELDSISTSAVFRLTPKFICEATKYVAVLRVSHSDPDSTETSEMDSRYLPDNGKWPQIEIAPWGIPNGPEAWAPNGFAGSLDDDGYTTLTKPFKDNPGIFHGHQNQIANVTLTVATFEMESHGSKQPWMPTVGRAASKTFRIAPKPVFSLTSATIDENFVTINGTITKGWLGSGQMTLDVEDFRWICTRDGQTTTHLHALIEPQSLQINYRTENTLIDPPVIAAKIPLTALDGDAFFDVVQTLVAGGTVELRAYDDIYLRSPYGSVGATYGVFTLPTSWGPSMTIDVDPYAYLTITQNPLATRFEVPAMAPVIRLVWTTSYILSDSERGHRLIKIPGSDFTGSEGFPLVGCFASGSALSTQSEKERALIFRRLESDTTKLHLYIHETTNMLVEPLASLTYQDARNTATIIPLEGNITADYSESRQFVAAQRLGGTRYLAAVTGTKTPSLKFSGTIFRGQLANLPASTISEVEVSSSVSDLYRIPADAICLLRTAHGTTHQVIVTSIDSPRSVAGLAQVTINMIEVE